MHDCTVESDIWLPYRTDPILPRLCNIDNYPSARVIREYKSQLVYRLARLAHASFQLIEGARAIDICYRMLATHSYLVKH